MSSKKTVFMILSTNLENGKPVISTFFRHKADSLKQEGWQVEFGVVDDRTSVAGIRRNIDRLRNEIQTVNPNLVHTKYGSVTALVGHWVRGKLPLVTSFVGDDLLGTPNQGLKWRLREKLARYLSLQAARRAQAIVVRSRNLYNALPSALQRRTTVFPDGVDLDFYKLVAKDHARGQLGWDSTSKIILFNAGQGTNQNVKNRPLAESVFHSVRSRCSSADLKVISKAGSDEVNLMLNAADCLLVTSFHEGAPKIVQEAMACNLPVVTVPCGDVEERLTDVRPSRVCSYSEVDLTEAVLAVFEVDSRSNGRQQVIDQRITTPDTAKILVGVYSEVLSG